MKSLIKGFTFIGFANSRRRSGTALAPNEWCERTLSIRS